jgi:predicted nucleotide-binding protein
MVSNGEKGKQPANGILSDPEAKEREKVIEPAIKKRQLISQSVLPQFSLERSLAVAKAICDQYGSSPTLPHLVANAVGYSQTSYNWRLLSGSAVAYGLTNGAYNSEGISITSLAISILQPTEEGEREKALIESTLKPKILNEFFKKYDRQKFPQKEFALSVLQNMMGVPSDRAEKTFEIINENGRFTGIITDTKTGLYVSINTGLNIPKKENNIQDSAEPAQSSIIPEPVSEVDELTQFAASVTKKFDPTKQVIPVTDPEKTKNNRVFVSHGKNKLIVEQLKEIIQYGKYEPIISVERESTSKPVPEKVLDDMRSCFAGVILINTEEELTDQAGRKHKKINDNVLIEIGAALALYNRNNILLVQKGVDLPSNLQGLYRCEYEGDTLDMVATLKLLKGFNDFNNIF